MAKIYEEIDDHLRRWVGRQRMFFVATAPLSGDGHVNVSPKGPIDTLRILWGTGDRVLTYPRYAARLRKLVPHAELVELPGLGHTPMWDDPGLLVRNILEVTSGARVAQPA